MRKRTLLSMSLALMIGMTTLAAPVLATNWGHDTSGKNYRQKSARGDGALHRRHHDYARDDRARPRRHHDYARRDWRPGPRLRQRLRHRYRPYLQQFRHDYYGYYRPPYHRGGHYGYGYGDGYAYDDRSGLTIIYKGGNRY